MKKERISAIGLSGYDEYVKIFPKFLPVREGWEGKKNHKIFAAWNLACHFYKTKNPFYAMLSLSISLAESLPVEPPVAEWLRRGVDVWIKQHGVHKSLDSLLNLKTGNSVSWHDLMINDKNREEGFSDMAFLIARAKAFDTKMTVLSAAGFAITNMTIDKSARVLADEYMNWDERERYEKDFILGYESGEIDKDLSDLFPFTEVPSV